MVENSYFEAEGIRNATVRLVQRIKKIRAREEYLSVSEKKRRGGFFSSLLSWFRS